VIPANQTDRLASAEIDSLIAELDAEEWRLPESAIVRIRELRELAIPRLLDAVRNATALARLGRPPAGNAHFFALFLLAEFRANEALPTILEAMSLPGELPFDLFSDAVTEILARVIADLADDPRATADVLIRDPRVNEYVRWEGAETYVFLVRDGRLSPEEAVEGLRQHLRAALDAHDDEIVPFLISVLTCLGPREAMAEIEEAFTRELIDPLFMKLSHVREAIKEGPKNVRRALNRCAPAGIVDALHELRQWAEVREPDQSPALSARDEVSYQHEEPVLHPIVRDQPRVGRNDPCPCGSGKKFKRCCGGAPRNAR
jgi:hypothetical protein